MYFAPTPHRVADAMLQLARVTRNDVVYDLGSGDGRILVIAAQKYGAQGVGVEIDASLVERSRRVANEGGVADRITFVHGDLFAVDLSKATVVTLYLSTTINLDLASKLKRELRPGARIVSHKFAMGDWVPDETIQVDGQDLFLWRIPGGGGGKGGPAALPKPSFEKRYFVAARPETTTSMLWLTRMP
jgi:SAM-dependent methyltransferase